MEEGWTKILAKIFVFLYFRQKFAIFLYTGLLALGFFLQNLVGGGGHLFKKHKHLPYLTLPYLTL